MLKASIRSDNPVLFTESIALYSKPGPVPDDEDFVLPIGKADVKREGRHVTLVAYARGVDWSLEAAEALAKDGIECEVIDMRWLRPLDMATVYESFKKTNRCVVVEESLPMYSFGSEIAARIQDEMFDYMDAPVKRVTAMDVPLPYAREIELMALPDTQKVIDAVRQIV
jgi:pyruvate dehydrogenase E1 component beta subunit